MRLKLLFIILLFNSSIALAQKDTAEKIIAFKITDYIKKLTDSSVAVQVINPAVFPVLIKDKQLGVLYHAYKTGAILDTAMVGWGRCNLIKGDYHYFGIRLSKGQQALDGDLIYMKLKVPYVYDGLLLAITNHAINFTNVYGEDLMKREAVFTNTKKDELAVLDSMVSDIKFTGNAMLQQMPEQNQVITDGIYKGKKVLDAMQLVNRNEVESFLKYIIARPKKYAGNTWKISETFATWMAGGTPTVIEN